jgi:type I restriction enzyme S subunit
VGRHNVAKVKGPGVLIGRSGSIGGGQYIKQDFWPLNTTLWVKDFKGNNQRFVFYLLRGIDFTRFNAGAGVPTLNRNHLANILIREWPLEVQNKITSILSAYDDLIENNNRRIALLEESARLLYREWFVRLRFPGHENTRITDGVPEGWERMFVPDIIDINPKEKIEKGKDIRSIPMACLSTNSTVIDTDRVEIKPKASGAKFRNGDVILPRITPCLENGKTALVKFLSDNEVACGSTEYIILRGQMVSPEFTYCLARTYDFRENAIKSMVGSSGRQRVQVSCFQDFLVPLAPRILLDQFDNIAKPNFMMIQTLQTQNHKLKTARDLLLPKLMNGEIPV